jgi:hypothetical protein
MLRCVFEWEDAALWWAVVVGGRGRYSCGLKCTAGQKDDDGIAWRMYTSNEAPCQCVGGERSMVLERLRSLEGWEVSRSR